MRSPLWKTQPRRVGTPFSDLSLRLHGSESCEASQPPEALATPDPLLSATGAGERVAVSFIIGADGQVHSPVILESAGSLEDGNVLNALRSWHYRPALCNDAPAESESRVEFSSR
jgi:TonB family protein